MSWGRPPSCRCGTCPKCRAAARARERYRALSLEERRARRARRDRERQRAADRARHQRFKNDEAYQARRRARFAVRNAIRAGRLTREACEDCGSPETHAHHDDYSRPLDVRWLCTVCHAAEHAPEAKAA